MKQNKNNSREDTKLGNSGVKKSKRLLSSPDKSTKLPDTNYTRQSKDINVQDGRESHIKDKGGDIKKVVESLSHLPRSLPADVNTKMKKENIDETEEKLKTLKDLNWEDYRRFEEESVSRKELRAEAVKWFKLFVNRGDGIYLSDWIYFFNLTEEDLK